MIKLAMELPTCKLHDWSSYADFDFVLSHKVLQDKAYAEFFATRPAGREVLLDNGYHEEGVSLSVNDLREAARRCKADYVIAPDKVGDHIFNMEQFLAARRALWPAFKIAVVATTEKNLSGFDLQSQRESFLFTVREADMLCLTFKEPKRYYHYVNSAMSQRWYRIHLLGCAELSELQAFAGLARNSTKLWSMDTGKALKHALRGAKMDELDSVRLSQETTEKGLPSEQSQKLLELTQQDIPDEVEELFKHNVNVLRSCMR